MHAPALMEFSRLRQKARAEAFPEEEEEEEEVDVAESLWQSLLQDRYEEMRVHLRLRFESRRSNEIMCCQNSLSVR